MDKELERYGGSQTRQLVRRKQELETELDQINQRQNEIESEIQNYKQLRQEIASKLREFEAVGEVQKQRDDLEAQKQMLRDELDKSRMRLRSLLSTQGYAVLLTKAIAKFQELEKEMRQRGQLPADIK